MGYQTTGVWPIAGALGAESCGVDLKDKNDSRKTRPLLDSLNDHCIALEFSCRVRWEPRQLTLWDNWTNAINDCNRDRRQLRRLTVARDCPS